MRSVLVIGVGLIVIVGVLYVGFRNQNAAWTTDVPMGKPLDFSQHRCEEILYGRGYQTKIIAPDNEIEARPSDQIRVPSSGPLESMLWFNYQGYNYEKACPDPLDVADTNIKQWHLVKGQLYENLHEIGIELIRLRFCLMARLVSIIPSLHCIQGAILAWRCTRAMRCLIIPLCSRL